MATKKKTKTVSRPSVPTAQTVPTLTAPSEAPAPKYEPMSVEDFNKFMKASYDVQLQYAPQLIGAQKLAQEELYRSMGALQREQGPLTALTASQLANSYAPTFLQQYEQEGKNIANLGGVATRGLAAGYELGPELSSEIGQAIRGAQTARGNILGAAPTAQEAFGKGQAAIDLYNQRFGQMNQFLGTQQNYLQSRNPADLMSQMAGGFMGATYYPSQSYVDTGLGANAAIASGTQGQQYNSTVMSGYSSFQNALQDYNRNQISGTDVNNQGLFNTYDRSAESWMYDEAVRRGLYSTPSLGGSSGGMGGMGGMISSGLGAGVSTGLGLAATGATVAGLGATGTALAGGAAAAISAAGAAICWLARRCIPKRWEEWQRYLFTDAPEKLRRFYIYNARRLAREISDDEAIEIGGLMNDCLNLRSLA